MRGGYDIRMETTVDNNRDFLQSSQTGLIGISLACSICKLYGFVSFGIVPEVFGPESDPKMWFGCIAHKLDALFVIKGQAATMTEHTGHTHVARSGKKLWLSLAVTLLFCGVEAVAGWVSHSLALVSDAGHNLSDALALGLAAYAIWVGQKPATAKHTYGFHRVAILTALFNASTLVVI